MKTITIAVMTYNRAFYLHQMLSSILEQTNYDFLVKIYDNCSTDNTVDIIKPLLSDSRFCHIRNEINIGALNNFNRAIKECTTDYLLITHDDDIMHDDMINKQLVIFEKYNNVNLVCVNNNFIDSTGKLLQSNIYDDLVGSDDLIIDRHKYLEYYLNNKNLISCPTAMIRMSAVRSANLLFRNDVGKSADTFFWLELNNLPGPFYYISKALYDYRKHDEQDSLNTIFMIPMLKKPVYELMIDSGYDTETKQKWIAFVNSHIYQLFRTNNYTRKTLRSIKKNIFIETINEPGFRAYFNLMLYTPSLSRLWFKLSKVARRYTRFIRKLL